ncbi:MAG: class I SAM-dependent methyltransferase [Bacteroidia bacterium]
MKQFWNERYSEQEFVYGKEANIFFAETISKLPVGKIILPCEGEGRNGVYAASLGWEIYSFDSSEIAKTKALKLCHEKKVNINYIIDDAEVINYSENSADVVAFIYAHFPAQNRKKIHQKAISWLKPGGKIILEAFNPMQLSNTSGGPKDISMLYTEDMLRKDFEGMNIDLLQSTQTTLAEGKYHKGKADIIRLIATKK